MTIYLESGDELVLEGCAPSETIYVGTGSTLGYGENQHDFDTAYAKLINDGIVEIHAGVTLQSTRCYFNGDHLEVNTTGGAYYVNTIGAGGSWIVDGWEPEGPTETVTAYVTKNGLKVVTNRLVSNLFNGNQKYSGKLDKIRAYIDLDDDGVGESYLDLDICTAYCTTETSPVEYFHRAITDEVYGTTYYATPMTIRAIVPEGKYGYDGVTDTFRFFTTASDTLSITSLDLLTETDTVFATANIVDLEIDDNDRKFIEWEIRIGNDEVPKEWSGHERSKVTKFGTYVMSNRLLWNDNSSPHINSPVGIYLDGYGENKDFSENTGRLYFYDDSGATWSAITSNKTVDEDDIVMIGNDVKFGSVYLEFATLATGNEHSVIPYYYNGSWTIIPSYGDSTKHFKRNGFIEFHMPPDWIECVDPSTGTVTMYAIRLKLVETATVDPILKFSACSIYEAEVLSSVNQPENSLTLNVATNVFPSQRSPKTVITSSFSADDVGRITDEFGYSYTGESKVVRGIELTTYNALKELVVEPEKVTIQSYNTGDFNGCLFGATGHPRPDYPLLVYSSTTKRLMNIVSGDSNSNFAGSVFDSPLYHFISGIRFVQPSWLTGPDEDFELYYMPKEITIPTDASSIRAIYGPVQSLAYPTAMISGVASENMFSMTPLELAKEISDKDPLRKTSGDTWHIESTWKVEPYTKMKRQTSAIHGSYSPFKYKTTGYRPVETRKTIEPGWMGSKYIVNNNNSSYIYAFESTRKYPVILMAFDNPSVGETLPVRLQLGVSMTNSIKVNGWDVFAWSSSDTEGRWENIGGLNSSYGTSSTVIKDFDITLDSAMVGDTIFIAVVSKIPQFNNAHGIFLTDSFDKELLNKTFNDIEDAYRKTDSSGNETDVSPSTARQIYIGDNGLWVEVIFARMVGMSIDSGGSLQRYEKGIDYTYDEGTKTVTLVDRIYHPNVTTETYNQYRRGYKATDTPSIGWYTDVYSDVGSCAVDGDGEVIPFAWHDGSNIEPYIHYGLDDENEVFNLNFALSKVPYAMDGTITVIFDGVQHRTYKQGEGFFIRYMDNYQYSADNKYRDNKIERTESGSGCWVVSVSDAYLEDVGMFGNVSLNEPRQCTVVIQYPYLKDNIIVVDYIEDTDFGIFSKSFLEEDTYSTPKKVSSLDKINLGIQVEAHWPRDLEPNVEN